jgi:hypothetical protein
LPSVQHHRILNPDHTPHDGSTLYKAGHRDDYFPRAIEWIVERTGSYDTAIIDPYEEARYAQIVPVKAVFDRAERMSRVSVLGSLLNSENPKEPSPGHSTLDAIANLVAIIPVRQK